MDDDVIHELLEKARPQDPDSLAALARCLVRRGYLTEGVETIPDQGQGLRKERTSPIRVGPLTVDTMGSSVTVGFSLGRIRPYREAAGTEGRRVFLQIDEVRSLLFALKVALARVGDKGPLMKHKGE